MKFFLVFLALFIVVKGDGHLNLDSHDLLNTVKKLNEDALKAIDEVPDRKVNILHVFDKYSKKLPASFSSCEEVRELAQQVKNASSTDQCKDILTTGTTDLDNVFIKNVRTDMDWLFDRLNSITQISKTRLSDVKKKLEKYSVKYEPCAENEVGQETCGALLDFEKDIHKYRNKIEDYLSNLTYLAHFIGTYVEMDWTKTASSLADQVISPVKNCLSSNAQKHYQVDII